MFIASYDEITGEIKGFRDSTISYPTPTPIPFIEITDKQHQEFFNRNQCFKVIESILTYVTPTNPTLQELKQCKWNEIKVERERLEQAGVPYLGKTLDSDAISIRRMAVAVQAAQAAIVANTPFMLNWTMKDNTVVTMDAEQIVGMSVALLQYLDSLHQISRALRMQIEAAETAEQVANIQWTE